MYFIISLLFCFKGKPLKPPAPIFKTVEFVDLRFSLLIVVFVATRPSKFISNAKSITSSNCSVVKSGAIFKRIGLQILSFEFADSPISFSTNLSLAALLNLVYWGCLHLLQNNLHKGVRL